MALDTRTIKRKFLISLSSVIFNLSILSSASPQSVNSTTSTKPVASGGSSPNGCSNGLLTFELATGFIYKPSSEETLAMMPSTLQLTDCLDYCLTNSTCLAINFEMGLCVLLSSSAKQNPTNLYSSQFPVFTIYAEKKCLLAGDPQASRQRRKCQRAWTFERVAGYEMKTKPTRRMKLANKELCMEACLLERDFECRSANWYRQTNECTLSDQDRHSVSQSEAGDQSIRASALRNFYGPSNLTATGSSGDTDSPPNKITPISSTSLYENYYANVAALNERASSTSASSGERDMRTLTANNGGSNNNGDASGKYRKIRQLFDELGQHNRLASYLFRQKSGNHLDNSVVNNFLASPFSDDWLNQQNRHNGQAPNQYIDTTGGSQQYQSIISDAPVDYLENNCIYEPNKLCEFRKIQNRILKTVDSIYQDVASVEECKQKCLNAPYRCYSFDYGDTSERVCRTSHLDQASLLAVREPYLDVVGAITYELASCFNVTIQCRAKEMVASVSSSKMFKGKIYAKTRPSTCVNDVGESLKFELSMKYHDDSCNVRASSNSQQGVFSNDIVIQHHDRIVTTQDVGLSVYCQYDLGNRSITNNVDLAIEKIELLPSENKIQQHMAPNSFNSTSARQPVGSSIQNGDPSSSSPLMITGLATTIVRSPNVTMRITNMNGQPVSSATVGDRLALLFEVKEKTSPFGIFVREIVAMDGKQVMQSLQAAMAGNKQGVYHYASSQANGNGNNSTSPLQFNENSLDYMIQTNSMANSVQFIDSDGCPTDANIMGPLIKMDSNGHRILAPFDAFKFPSSDMVFFRAVVTSCLAECASVICSPGSGGVPAMSNVIPPLDTDHVGTANNRSPVSGEAQLPVTPKTQSKPPHNNYMDSSISRTTPNSNNQVITIPAVRYPTTTTTTQGYEQYERMVSRPTANSTNQVIPQTAATSSSQLFASTLPVSSAGSPLEFGPNKLYQFPVTTTTPALWSTTTSAPTTTSGQQSTFPTTTTSSGRLAPDQQRTTIATDALTTIPGYGPQEATSVGDSSSLLSSWFNQSLTNNHNGRAPIKLQSTTIAPSSSSFNPNKMSLQQKLQFVRLFEAKLKQQQQQQQMLDTQGSSSNSSASQQNISDLADLYTGFLASLMLKGNVNDNKNNNLMMSGNFIMSPEVVGDSTSDTNYKRDETHGNLIMPQQLQQDGDQFQVSSSVESLPEASSGNNLDRLLSHLTNEITNQNISDSLSSGIKKFVNLLVATTSTTTTTSTTSQPEDSPIEMINQMGSTSSNAKQIRSQQQQDSSQKNNSNSVSGAGERSLQRKKKDKAQALADSYLGAYHSMGKRRRRRDAEATNSDLSTGYVYMEQPIESEISNSDSHRRFTRAIVELYHTSRDGASSGQEQQYRTKRSVGAVPAYDQEELVVQSIKIVDRLHFEDEQQADGQVGSNKKTTSSKSKKSPMRSAGELIVGEQPLTSTNLRLANWSSAGVMSVLIMAISFIFVQVFLVALYIIDLSRRRRLQQASSSNNNHEQQVIRSQYLNQSNQYYDDDVQYHSHHPGAPASTNELPSPMISSLATDDYSYWTSTATSSSIGSSTPHHTLDYHHAQQHPYYYIEDVNRAPECQRPRVKGRR